VGTGGHVTWAQGPGPGPGEEGGVGADAGRHSNKKNVPRGPNNARCVVWALFFLTASSLS
jgi:hypothetical protein